MDVLDTAVAVPDGPLLAGEAVLPAGATVGAVLTHPHPLMGGDMTNPVPAGLFAALGGAGVAALRFDFRGTGRSGGSHDGGRGEADDLRAAVRHLDGLMATPAAARWIVGYSFGADVATQVVDEGVTGWILVAPPLRSVPVDAMAVADDDRPTLVVVPAHDQFLPPDAARRATATWRATEVVVLAGADHFMAGRVAALGALVASRLTGRPT